MPCSREHERRRYEANPEKHRERARRWREANPEKRREQDAVKHARRRARKRGLPFDEDAVRQCVRLGLRRGVCPVFGTPFTRGGGRAKPTSLSVDRIKPELGYVAGNLEAISFKANAMQSNATAKEMLQVAVHCYLSRGQEHRLRPRLEELIAEWHARNDCHNGDDSVQQ